MNTQEHDISIVEAQTPESLSEQPALKQPWSRPTVTFVPIQVTAGSLRSGSSDGTASDFS